MSKIILENMEFHANHGVMEHEKMLGNTFLVTVEMEVNTEKAGVTDHLEDTINYQLVYHAVKKQIEIPSNLIEHVARRIVDKLMNKFLKIQAVSLTLSKMNPPLGGKVEKVSIQMERRR
ncbi:MAG: dihydroneopterin aldolase [Paludibacter sp.]|nr:dihydroneopterin aldolase [Paludibacter sp.]MDD4199726.1 dihydroneopterin aldolase [Paludibacter sp.]MDD4428573.1 dihydroneopterin aldolase [Paludibacter sp.]